MIGDLWVRFEAASGPILTVGTPTPGNPTASQPGTITTGTTGRPT